MYPYNTNYKYYLFTYYLTAVERLRPISRRVVGSQAALTGYRVPPLHTRSLQTIHVYCVYALVNVTYYEFDDDVEYLRKLSRFHT